MQFRAGKFEEATQSLDRAMELWSEEGNVTYAGDTALHAMCQFKLGDLVEARKLGESLLQDAEGPVDEYDDLNMILVELRAMLQTESEESPQD